MEHPRVAASASRRDKPAATRARGGKRLRQLLERRDETRRAQKREHGAALQNKKGLSPETEALWKLIRRRPTFPHSYPCSIIGPARLNFRVRDGNGCDPRGMTTGNLEKLAALAISVIRYQQEERTSKSFLLDARITRCVMPV